MANGDTGNRMPNQKGEVLKHLEPGRLKKIQEVFKLLEIEEGPYPGADDFSRKLRRASRLQYEGVKFSTSGSSLSSPDPE